MPSFQPPTTIDAGATWLDWSSYILPGHLNGAVRILEITQVTSELIHFGQKRAEQRPVLYFSGKQRGLSLSAKHRRVLQSAFGIYIKDVIGKKIGLRAVDGQGQNKVIDISIPQQEESECK